MIIQYFLIIFLINIKFIDCYSFFKRVKLFEVTSLTLYHDNFTIGRKPIPQLSCIGDNFLCNKYSPSTVQCLNRGFDGIDVQWKCEAILSTRVKFGKNSVECEGYSWPKDIYVIKGSCSFKYSLEYNSAYDPGINVHYKFFWLFIGLVFVVFFLLSCLFYYKAKKNIGFENFHKPSAPVLHPRINTRQNDNPIFWIKCDSSRDIRQENPPSYNYCVSFEEISNKNGFAAALRR